MNPGHKKGRVQHKAAGGALGKVKVKVVGYTPYAPCSSQQKGSLSPYGKKLRRLSLCEP